MEKNARISLRWDGCSNAHPFHHIGVDLLVEVDDGDVFGLVGFERQRHLLVDVLRRSPCAPLLCTLHGTLLHHIPRAVQEEHHLRPSDLHHTLMNNVVFQAKSVSL